MSIDGIEYDNNLGFASMTLTLTRTLTMIRYPDHKQDIGQDFYLELDQDLVLDFD